MGIQMQKQTTKRKTAPKAPQPKQEKVKIIQTPRPKRRYNAKKELVQLAESVLGFGNVIMPRPVSAPTSTYVARRINDITSSANSPLDFTFISTPDTFNSTIVYQSSSNNADWNSITVTDVIPTRLEPRNLESFKTLGNPIFVVPGYGYNLNKVLLPRCKKSSSPNISFMPDFRNFDSLIPQSNSIPYFNIQDLAGKSIHTRVEITGTVLGSTLELVMWPNRDIIGSNTKVIINPILSTSTTQAWDVQYPFQAGQCQSFSLELKNVGVLDSILLSGLTGQPPNFDYLDIPPVILSDLDDTENGTWAQMLNNAENWAITGLAVTLTNQAPTVTNNGAVSIALFPATYPRLTDSTEMSAAVSSRRLWHYNGQVITGAHGIWAPRSIEDLFPQPVHSRILTQFIAGSAKYSSLGGTQTMRLAVTTRKEIQTNSNLISSYIPIHSPTALSHIFGAITMNLHKVYGDNPNHMKRIYETAVSIAQSPAFKAILAELGPALIRTLAVAPLSLI